MMLYRFVSLKKKIYFFYSFYFLYEIFLKKKKKEKNNQKVNCNKANINTTEIYKIYP
jgi:hypothetical protein